MIVHLAAMLMKASRAAPRGAFAVNAAATHSLLWASTQQGNRCFVLGSSVGVYGIPAPGSLVTETSPIGACTCYGAGKFSSELYCRCFSESFDLPYIALRLGTLYGDRLHADGFYAAHLLSLMDRLDESIIEVEGQPDEHYDFLYVGGAAEAVVQAVHHDVRDIELNVVSGRSVSWEEIVTTLLRAAGSETTVEWRSRNGDAWAVQRNFSGDLAREVLGFSPAVSLTEGLSRLVRWYPIHPRPSSLDQ